MLLLFTDSGASGGGDATLAAAGPATVASASSDLSAGCVDSAPLVVGGGRWWIVGDS